MRKARLVIIAVLILNAILGTVQYVKAEKSLDALKSMSAPVAKVLRNGAREEIAWSRMLFREISSFWRRATWWSPTAA